MPEQPDTQFTTENRAAKPRGGFRTAARILRWILLLTGALVFVVTFTPVDRWWARSLAGQWEDVRGDNLVVLGASGAQDGIIPYDTYLRCEYAVRTYREGWVKRIVVSGGGGSNSPVATAMRDYLVGQGIPSSRVIPESNSNSTRENAEFLKQILQSLPGKSVLLTSDYHSYRARRVFAKVGIPVQVRPIPDALKRASSLSGRWPTFLVLCQETVKIGYYRLRSWI